MKTIKLTKAVPGYLEGQVLEVDENSAAALVDRGDAELVPDPETADAVEPDHEPAAEDSSAADTGVGPEADTINAPDADSGAAAAEAGTAAVPPAKTGKARPSPRS